MAGAEAAVARLVQARVASEAMPKVEIIVQVYKAVRGVAGKSHQL